MKKNIYLGLIAAGIILSPGISQAQLAQISVMPGHPSTATMYQPPAGYANFPCGFSMDVLNAGGTAITKRLLVSFGTSPDNYKDANNNPLPPTIGRIVSMDGGVTWANSYQAYGHDAVMTIRRRDGTLLTYPFWQVSTGAPNYSLKYWTSPVNSNGAAWSPAYPSNNTGTVNTNLYGHRSIIEEPNGDLYANRLSN